MQSAANQSPHQIPYNREINRELRKIGSSRRNFVSDQRAHSMPYSGIPYATEQGIFKCVSGNFFRGTGKFNQATARRCNCSTTPRTPTVFAGKLEGSFYNHFASKEAQSRLAKCVMSRPNNGGRRALGWFPRPVWLRNQARLSLPQCAGNASASAHRGSIKRSR